MSSYTDTQLYIDGQWRDARDKKTLAVFNPATGQEIGRVAHASIDDVQNAALASVKGFRAWRVVPAFERAKIMRKAASLMRERQSATATLLTQEQGKPLHEATMETASAADVIEWFADEGMRVYGRVVPARNSHTRQLVVKDPVGPVAAFTPWNFPINQAVRKISAALTCGCSIILKAPEETPAAAAALVRAFADAGVPAGAIGLIYGNPAEISQCLITHPAIRKITFTGSTPVGKQLAALAGQHMKRATMELGGHAPVIICEDADLALALSSLSAAKFRNAGQVCISPTRFLVHESVVAKFTNALAEHARGLKVGNGLDAGVQMGPLANARRVHAIQELMTDAVAQGASVAAGGQALAGPGNFWAPTVLADVPLSARLFNEEPFGPIAAIRSFAVLDEAIQEANRLPFGLAAYAFTSSLRNTHQLSQQLEAGMLWVNQPAAPWPEMPFGGVKDSGYGSEGGPEALEAYLNTRAISVANV